MELQEGIPVVFRAMQQWLNRMKGVLSCLSS